MSVNTFSLKCKLKFFIVTCFSSSIRLCTKVLFKREFVDVLSGVNVVYTRICICAVWCGCCLNENL